MRRRGFLRLVTAATDHAAMAMVHQTETVDGVSRMRMAHAIAVPAEGTVQFAPGGTHIMLEGLKQPLVAGEGLVLELTFDQSGRMVVPVKIVAPGER